MDCVIFVKIILRTIVVHIFVYKFQHALVETEAEHIRTKVKTAIPLMQNFMKEITNTITRQGENLNFVTYLKILPSHKNLFLFYVNMYFDNNFIENTYY